MMAAITLAGALLEIGRMFRYLFRSVTNVLWVDQWIMLEELWRFRDGRYTLAYLWTPYWGHRIPVPRLLFLLDERLFHFSNVPLVVLNVLMQACSIAILSAAQWKLLSTKSRPLAVGTIAVTFYLLFSGLQMENFVYGMSVQYAIGYACAIAAIVSGARASRFSYLTGVACALLSTLTIAAGLVLWPALAFEIFLLRGPRRRIIALIGIGALIAVAYSVGYSQPGNGMGVLGMSHHPLQAIGIATMFLGGPLSLASIIWGQVAGTIGIALFFYLLAKCFNRKPARSELVALVTVVLWLIAISFSIPLARMRPDWVASFHGTAPLPSRYFTPAFLFWCCLTAAVLWKSGNRIVTSFCLLAAAAVTFSTIAHESAYLNDWLSFCQRLDATASGFLIGAQDQEYMARSYPDQGLLDHWIPYAREYKLSVFAEPRATWAGQSLARLAQLRDDPTCRLILDPLSKAGPATRLTGSVEGPSNPLAGQEDVLLTDSAGTVIGIGRTFIDARNGEYRRRFIGFVPGPLNHTPGLYLLPRQGPARACVTSSLSSHYTDRSSSRNVLR